MNLPQRPSGRATRPSPGCPRWIKRLRAGVLVAALALAGVPTAAQAASIPSTPGHVQAVATGTGTVDVTWSAVSGATSYVVSNGSVSSANLSSTGYVWGGLAPGTYMCFTVTAKNSAGQSPWSPYSCVTTSVPTPTHVTANATSADNVSISWSDSAPGASFVISNGDITAGSTGPGVTQFNWNGLAPDTYMCFTIAAKEGNGQSAWSAYACATTFGGDPWDQPTDWFGHASNGGQSDPVNIVLTGTSTLGLDAVYGWLHAESDSVGTWTSVGLLDPAHIDTDCMNALSADVDSAGDFVNGYVDQELSVREGGCGTLLTDGVDHFRAWDQPETGATFIAASIEKPCVSFTPPFVSHCVIDYDGGRDRLVSMISLAANENGFPVNVQYETEYPSGTVTQLDGSTPGYDGQVAVVTVG